jgi:Leucine-rich repeat (LRR) protein
MTEHPAAATSPKKLLPVLGVLGACLGAVVAVVGVWWLLETGKNDAELAARDQLRQLEALIGMDASQDHVGTIIIRKNLDQALPLVGDLHRLTHLDLADTEFADQQAPLIVGLSRLNSLVLSNTKITDEGLMSLQGLPVASLFLAGTAITPAAVDVISGIPSVQSLDLSRTNVQENLAPLARLPNLEWLLLNDVDLSNLGDDALDALARVPKLGRLTLKNTNISDAAVRRLKAARPGINIQVGGDDETPTLTPGAQ